jgi:hypothetical protein
MIKRASLFICLLIAAHGIASADIMLAENFNNIAALPGSGWAFVNNSAPLGTTGWFQGNLGVFSAQAGPADSYIAANWLNAGLGGNISNWLLTPEVSLNEGSISFYTRSNGEFADRLELRLSTNGASTNVGGTDSSVGDFNTLLLSINPGLSTTGYPDAWTGFTVPVGLGAGATGRYAFRYFVTDTNNNGDYIGIDSVSISAVPEPASILGLATIIAGLALRRRVGFRR